MPRLKRRAQEMIIPQATEGRVTRKKRSYDGFEHEMYNGQNTSDIANAFLMSSCGMNPNTPYEDHLLPFLPYQPNCSTAEQQYTMNKQHTMLKNMLNVSSNPSHQSNICHPSQLPHHQTNSTNTFSGHPNVTFAPHPFYDNVNDGQVLRITTLMSRAPPHFVKGENSTAFAFSLNDRQAALFPQSRIRNSYQPSENEMAVLLRFCKYDQSSEQEDALPVHLTVTCNNMTVPLQCPLPTNKTGMDGRRIGRPVEITSQVYFVPGTPNTMTIHWHYDPDNKFQSSIYCLAIFLVRRLSPNDLMKKLQRRQRSDDVSKKMIQKQLSADDSDLSMSSLGASLMCPLGKTRIGLPIRSNACRHVQCFDAFCYLAMNERRPTWRCPACDESAPFRDLYVDAYFSSILASAKSEATRVDFLPDGRWLAKGDDDADEEEEVIRNCREEVRRTSSGGTGTTSCPSTVATPSCSAEAPVIDLTASDDEEPSHGLTSAMPADSTTNAASASDRMERSLPPPLSTADVTNRRKNPAPTRFASVPKPKTNSLKRPRLRPTTPEVIDLESSDESDQEAPPPYLSPGSGVPPLCHPAVSSACSSACSSSSSSMSASLPGSVPPGMPGLPHLPSSQMLHEQTKSSLGSLLNPYSQLPLPSLDQLLTQPLPPSHHHLLSAARHFPPSHQHSMNASSLPPYGPGPCGPSPMAGVPQPRLSHHAHNMSHYSQSQAHLASMNNFSFLHYPGGHPNPSHGGSAAGGNVMPPDGGYYV